MASQAEKAPPKGILKKPTPSSTVASSPPPSTTSDDTAPSSKKKKPDPRAVATQHAQIIHERRALEDAITDSIILLAKLPSTLPPPSSTTTSGPAAAAEVFKSHIRLFQPSDYDALIEERNALGRCGYCLCGRPRTSFGAKGGAYKILNWGRADFAIAPRAEVERWCGARNSTCARRAMYVKVQLSETAAWERAGIESIRIELLEEEEEAEKAEKERQEQNQATKLEKGGDEDTITTTTTTTATATTTTTAEAAEKLEGLRLRDNNSREETEKLQKAAQDARDLALERGDTDAEKAAKRAVDVTIREKKVITEVQEPMLAPGGEGHLVLDGYKTKFDSKSESISKGTTLTTTTADTTPDEDKDEAIEL